MSVQVENLEKSMVKLTIEVPAEEFTSAMDKAYRKMKGRISVPGFRKGKAPRAMVEKIYGPEIFYEDAANAVIPDAYENAASGRLFMISIGDCFFVTCSIEKDTIRASTVTAPTHELIPLAKETARQIKKYVY